MAVSPAPEVPCRFLYVCYWCFLNNNSLSVCVFQRFKTHPTLNTCSRGCRVSYDAGIPVASQGNGAGLLKQISTHWYRYLTILLRCRADPPIIVISFVTHMSSTISSSSHASRRHPKLWTPILISWFDSSSVHSERLLSLMFIKMVKC